MSQVLSAALFIAAAVITAANFSINLPAGTSALIQLLSAGAVVYISSLCLKVKNKSLASSCWILVPFVFFMVIAATGSDKLVEQLFPEYNQKPSVYIATVFSYYCLFPSVIISMELLASVPAGYGWKISNFLHPNLYETSSVDINLNSKVLRVCSILGAGSFTYMQMNGAISNKSLLVSSAIVAVGVVVGCISYTSNIIKCSFESKSGNGLKKAVDNISEATKYQGLWINYKELAVVALAASVFCLSFIFSKTLFNEQEAISVGISTATVVALWLVDLLLIRYFAKKQLKHLSNFYLSSL